MPSTGQYPQKLHQPDVYVSFSSEITPQPTEALIATMADSRDAIELREGGYAPVFYFPRQDVRMERLVGSPHTTYCPYKGSATYFSVTGGPANVAWSYEQPYDEMLDIKDLLAFYPSKVDSISVTDD